MKISQINQIKLRKLWCNSERILGVVVSTILSALLIAGPAIATCITAKQSGQSSDGNTANHIVRILHLAAPGQPYDGFSWGDGNDNAYAGTTIALLQNGKVYAWGNNMYGGVGNGTVCTYVKNAEGKDILPKRPPCYYNVPQEITNYFNGDKIARLTNKGGLAIAITESGKLYRWGSAYHHDLKPEAIINHPTKYRALDSYHITGYSGTDGVDHENMSNINGWFAYSDDTIFYNASLDYDDSGGNASKIIKPQLNGATIRQVDFVEHWVGGSVDRGGIYVLASNNKLFKVGYGGTAVEIANSKIAERGGIKQMHHNYAIDNRGGLWFYGHKLQEDPGGNIVDMSTEVAEGTLPALREFVNSNGESKMGHFSRPLVVRSADNHIYFLEGSNDGFTLKYKPIDMTTIISRQEIRLFHGDIDTIKATGYADKLLHDYSFVVEEDNRDLVCTAIDGASRYNAPSLGALHPSNTGKLRQQPGKQATLTCVKLPSGNPDPIKPPAPTPSPNQPQLPGVPNTGLRDDKVVQLVHSSTELDYYGEQKHGYKETWRDQDYAGTTVVLTESGKVYAWGNNIHGEVGNNTHCYSTLNKKPPCYYSDPQDITRYFEGNKIVKLANYDSILVAITDSGKMYHWGHDGTISHPVILKELSPYHIIGFGRGEGIFLNGPYKYLDKLSDNESGYLAFSKETIFALDYDVYDSNRVDWLRYHDEEKNRIKPKLNGATILDVDHIKHRTPTADKPEPDKGGYYVLTSNHKLLKVLEDGTTNEITNAEIKKRGGFKQLSYTGHYAIDMQGGLWSYGHGDGNDPIHDMAKMTAGGKLPHLDSFFSTIGPVTRGADGVIYAITDTHIDTNPSGYFLGRTVEPVKIGSFLSKQKIKLLSGEIETRRMEDTGYQAPDPTKDIPMYDYAFVPQDKSDTICVGLSGAAYNRIHGENRGPLFETIQPVDGTLPSTCVKLPPWNDGKSNPSPVPGAPTTPKAPGVPNTGSEPLFTDGYQTPIFARH